MAKIYQIDIYRLKKELRDLREKLNQCLEHGERFGFHWIDHYNVRELSSKIKDVKKKIEDEHQRHS